MKATTAESIDPRKPVQVATHRHVPLSVPKPGVVPGKLRIPCIEQVRVSLERLLSLVSKCLFNLCHMASLDDLKKRGENFIPDATKWFARATRLLEQPDTDWIREFMLDRESGLEGSILLSPDWCENAATINVSVTAFMNINAAFSCSAAASCLFVPAFTREGYLVGIVIVREARKRSMMNWNCGESANDDCSTMENVHAVGRFCLFLNTNELLVLAHRFPNEKECAHAMITRAASEITGTSLGEVKSSQMYRPSLRLLWWASQANPAVPWPNWPSRKEVVAICDWKKFEAGRYVDSVIVAFISGNDFRERCAVCDDRRKLQSALYGQVIPESDWCMCERDIITETLADNFAKMSTKLRFLEGAFVSTSDSFAHIPALGCAIAFEQLRSKSVQSSGDQDLADKLQQLAISNYAAKHCSRTLVWRLATCDLPEETSEVDRFLALDEQTGSAPSLTWNASSSVDPNEVKSIPVLQSGNSGCTPATQSIRRSAVAIAPRTGREMSFTSSVCTIDLQRIAKAELRKEKNRQAARISNARRKERLIYLKRSLCEAKLAVTELRTALDAHRSENAELKGQLSARLYFPVASPGHRCQESLLRDDSSPIASPSVACGSQDRELIRLAANR